MLILARRISAFGLALPFESRQSADGNVLSPTILVLAPRNALNPVHLKPRVDILSKLGASLKSEGKPRSQIITVLSVLLLAPATSFPAPSSHSQVRVGLGSF